MNEIRSLDHSFAFLKQILASAEIDPLSPILAESTGIASKWASRIDIAGVEDCLATLKIDVERANELIKYTTMTVGSLHLRV
jgi:hypothetical protein